MPPKVLPNKETWLRRVMPLTSRVAGTGVCAPGRTRLGLRGRACNDDDLKWEHDEIDVSECFPIAKLREIIFKKDPERFYDLPKRAKKNDVLKVFRELFPTPYSRVEKCEDKADDASGKRGKAYCFGYSELKSPKKKGKKQTTVTRKKTLWVSKDDIDTAIHRSLNNGKTERVVPLTSENIANMTLIAVEDAKKHFQTLKPKKDWKYAAAAIKVNAKADNGKNVYHWVVVFVDRQKRRIEYFDPLGQTGPYNAEDQDATDGVDKGFINLMEIAADCIFGECDDKKSNHPNVTIDTACEKSHQTKVDFESSGLYAIWYIWNRVNGRTKSYLNLYNFTKLNICEMQRRFFIG
jgi:Ulp1 protease family, C-terminal catalytic domain